MTEPASVKGREIELAEKKASEGGLWETVKVIVQALLIALVIRTVLFQPFNIPSGSLIPTLLIGDFLFVSKYSYGYSHYSLPELLDPTAEVVPGSRDLELWFVRIPSVATVMETLHIPPLALHGRILASQPKRGDIIVFKLPSDGHTDYIKRLIGLPGDKIQMIKDRLYINGVMVERTPLPPYDLTEGTDQPAEVTRYEETLPGGVKHQIIQLHGDTGDLADTGVFEVPPGHYFMMGDNRDNSSDSRDPAGGVGYVPFENLIGRAEVIFFSIKGGDPAWQFWRWPWDVRWQRLFRPVH
jgi:signal peptidase I